MVRINTLDRCGETLTIELMGYINKTELGILHDCLKEYAEEGITEVCIVANEVRNLNPLLQQDVIRLGQLGPRLRFQQLPFLLRNSLEIWGLEAWIDDK